MKEFVFVIENNKVIKLPVKTGIQDDMYIEIKEGLKEGQEVVVAPYLAISKMLKDGMQIEIVSKEDLYTSDEKK
jgi:HlyD family secretion protein